MPLSVQEQRTVDEMAAGIAESQRLLDYLFKDLGKEKPPVPVVPDPDAVTHTANEAIQLLSQLPPEELARLRQALGVGAPAATPTYTSPSTSGE